REDPMLEIRPNCELCDKDLPPQNLDAHICSYECTYCTDCVEKLQNVCPTCGGGFVPHSTPQILAAGTKSGPCKSAGQHATGSPQIYDGRHCGPRRSYQNNRAAR